MKGCLSRRCFRCSALQKLGGGGGLTHLCAHPLLANSSEAIGRLLYESVSVASLPSIGVVVLLIFVSPLVFTSSAVAAGVVVAVFVSVIVLV